MMHGPEDRRDHDIAVDRSNPNTYYDRDHVSPDPAYVNAQLEEVIHLYHSKRRRILIRRLGELDEEADGHVTIGHEDLAREVGAIEDDVEPEVVNWRSLRSIKTSLPKSHLPLLDEADAIDWDQDERTVETTPLTQTYAELIDRSEAAIEESEVPDLTDRRRSPW